MRIFKKKVQEEEATVKIVPNADTLHDRMRFEKGKTYVVTPKLARYFEQNGWLEGAEPPPPATLDIQNAQHEQTGGF